MIALRLHTTPESDRQFEAFIERVIAAGAPTEKQLDPIAGAIRAGFARNFDLEMAGDGQKWAPLAPYTVQDRIRHGYPGEHPILIRTGDYERSWIDEDHPDHFYEIIRDAGGILIQVGSAHALAVYHEMGTINMPDRPARTLDEESIRQIEQQLDQLFDQLFGGGSPK